MSISKAWEWNKENNSIWLNPSEESYYIAQVDGNVAGYVILLKSAKSGPYILQKIPEIVDLNVLIKYRNTGVGNRIMDVAEKLAHKGAAGKGSGVCTPHRFTVNANVI